MTKKPRILLIYTGGTIGMIKDYKTNALKAFDFSQIIEKIPELQQLDCSIQSVSFGKRTRLNSSQCLVSRMPSSA